jgi:hypothetical protein
MDSDILRNCGRGADICLLQGVPQIRALPTDAPCNVTSDQEALSYRPEGLSLFLDVIGLSTDINASRCTMAPAVSTMGLHGTFNGSHVSWGRYDRSAVGSVVRESSQYLIH